MVKARQMKDSVENKNLHLQRGGMTETAGIVERDVGGAVDLARDDAHFLSERHGVGIKRLEGSLAAVGERDHALGELHRAFSALGPMAALHGLDVEFLLAQLGDEVVLRLCVAREVIDGDDGRHAEFAHIGDMASEIGETLAQGREVLAAKIGLLRAAMHLERSRRRHDDGGGGREPGGAAFDVEEVLRAVDDQCYQLAKIFHTANDFLFLGRGIHYPIALEGALKLKEISYIHAEGYPAGEMKHGPNALIDETLPVVCIATKDPNDPSSVLKYEKTLSNIQEVTARSGRVIAIAIEGDEEIKQLVEHTIQIPQAPELLLPVLEVVPLQLLAYHIAVRRGCDVDQPRNLAKSVTVE